MAFKIADTIAKLETLMKTYYELSNGEDLAIKPAKPAEAKKIADFEKSWGHSLPPSYRAFLELRNGWKEFSGGSDLLSLETHKKKWVGERLDDIAELIEDNGDDNPFESGALPILLGEDTTDVLYLDPSTVRPDGEMDLIDLDIVEEVHRFQDFQKYLEHRASIFEKLIAAKKKEKKPRSK